MNTSRVLLVIIGCAIAIRLLALGFALNNVGVDGFIAGDAVVYTDLAKSLHAGVGFVTTYSGETRVELFRTPGFPIVLVPFMGFARGLVVYSVLMCFVIGIALTLLAYDIGSRFADSRVGVLLAALLAVEPHAVFYSFLYQTEALFLIVALAALSSAYRAYDRGSYWFAAVAGALFGYAILIRPGFLPVFIIVSLGTAGVVFFSRDRRFRHVCVMVVCAMVLLCPWYLRTHAVTGAYALSGAGWRNVYTDYLSSLRSLENGTPYYEEKNKLKEEALPRFGIERSDVDNPAYSAVFRTAALEEMWQHKAAVIRLESALLASFFLNDGYYYEFRMLGFVKDSGAPHISPTYTLLSEGVSGLPKIFGELARQKFIPVLGRGFTALVLISAIAGWVLARTRMRYAFAAVIVLSALSATAIGLGLDARMRFPVEPLLLLFSSVAFVRAYEYVKMRYAH